MRPDEKLKALLQILNEGVDVPSFQRAFKAIVEAVQRTRAELNAKIDARLATLKDGKDGRDGIDGTNGRDGRDGRDGVDGTNGKDGRDGVDGRNGRDGKDGSPDMAEDIRNKLELLQGEERLKASAISGLDDMMKPMHERMDKMSARVQTPAKAYKIHLKDCSSQCDGANKAFNVGGTHFGIVGVYSTQFPLIYRPLIDYTETATGFTLTAAVAAPESGQTLTAQFLK